MDVKMQRGGGNFGGGNPNGGRGRGRGGRGRGGGYGNNRGGMGRGGMQMQRIGTTTVIPVPPATPLDDPFVLPFPRLMMKVGTMTLDEQLLRAIIGQFTVISTGALNFKDLFDKLKVINPELIEAVYNSEPHFWSYIRCYPEQFGIDHDPRFPWNIYYLSKCKIVAKADRNRYKREFDAGNIRPVPDAEKTMDNVRYIVHMEKQAITHFYAIFAQWSRYANAPAHHLDMKKIATVFRPNSGVPKEICSYVGEVDAFLLKRLHCFNIFGGQVDMTPPAYTSTIRKLTLFLKERGDGGYMNLDGFYDGFKDPQFFTIDDYRAINLSEHFNCEDFLLFLHQHRLLFHLYTRENRIKLRHDIVPEIFEEEVRAVPLYKTLVDVFFNANEANMESTLGENGQPRALASHMQQEESFPYSDDDEDYDDGYADESFDGLPHAAPRHMHRQQNQPTVTTNVARQAVPAPHIAPPSNLSAINDDALASLRLVQAQNAAVRQNTPTMVVGPVQEDAEGVPFIQNIAPAATRFTLRGGARPPRASNRCRPPAPDRNSHFPNSSNVNWSSEATGTNSQYSMLERELEDCE